MATMFRSVYMDYMKNGLWICWKEVCGVVFDSVSIDSDTELVSFSSNWVDIIMEFPASAFSDEVPSYDSIFLKDSWMKNFWDWRTFLTPMMRVILFSEPCSPGKKVCLWRSHEDPDEYFYFYPNVIEDFGKGSLFPTLS